MADGNYVIMLRESLEKKIEILNAIIIENEKQKDLLRNPNVSPEDLDENVEAKAKMVDRLVELDRGFNSLFKQVEAILNKDRKMFAGEIAIMKGLIEKITDLSTKVKSQESDNFELAKERFGDIRTQIKKVRNSQQAVNTYYKNMMKVNYVDPQFMDNKK